MPWPKETRYLGKSTPRVEAPAKVTGRARFTADMSPPGMLYGAIFRVQVAGRAHPVDQSRKGPLGARDQGRDRRKAG